MDVTLFVLGEYISRKQKDRECPIVKMTDECTRLLTEELGKVPVGPEHTGKVADNVCHSYGNAKAYTIRRLAKEGRTA